MSWFPDIGIKPYHHDQQLTLFHGDCREVLASLPDESVHCAVTSPPYWGLRDYGIGSDALGLEPTPELYVEHLVEIFRELRRVLRKDGTLWLNLGDSYSSNLFTRQGNPRNICQPPNDWKDTTLGKRKRSCHVKVTHQTVPGLKPKDLIGIPWRVAFALQADGWYLRSDIIWHKPNPMPESVTDRPTSAHEYLFLLSRSSGYYYDADAIREPISESTLNRWGDRTFTRISEPGTAPERNDSNGKGESSCGTNPMGRNKRTVWTIATQPYPEAHFATYPQKVVEPCVLAGTSAWGVCPKCGAPWERIVEKERSFESGSGKAGNMPMGKNGANMQGGGETLDIRRGPVVHTTTTGWRKTCRHIADPVPATVLDPFSGSGTTLLVANNLGRRALGIEANADYCEMSLKRFGQGTMKL